MAIKNKKYLLLVIILSVFTSFLSAQNAGYFIEEKGDEVKYMQRFVWSGGEYALNYEVIFEREINGTYRPYLKEKTTTQFIELSLPPGVYRFRVIPYDILGKPAEGSAWVNIQVFAVPQPEQNQEQQPANVLALEPESEEETEAEEPEKEKTIFFRIGAVYEPRFILYGGNQNISNEDISGDGGGLRTSIVFKLPLDIYIGPELTAGVNRQGNIENWKLHYFTLGFNILAEKWSQNKIFGVGFRFGVVYPSIDIQKNWRELEYQEQRDYFKNETTSVYVFEEGFYAERLFPNIGASFYFLIKKHFLLELGFDYMHLFSTRDIAESEFSSAGFFCPRIGISYQF